MKAVVIYYSLEGNTKFVADKIATYLKADTIRLEPVKEYPKGKASKYIWGGKSVVFGETPKLSSYKFNAENYDTIIIGTPVWASSYAPPIKTFLKENKICGKKVALFACSAGGDASKCFQKFEQELDKNEVAATLSLIDPKVKVTVQNDQDIKEFCQKL